MFNWLKRTEKLHHVIIYSKVCTDYVYEIRITLRDGAEICDVSYGTYDAALQYVASLRADRLVRVPDGYIPYDTIAKVGITRSEYLRKDVMFVGETKSRRKLDRYLKKYDLLEKAEYQDSVYLYLVKK